MEIPGLSTKALKANYDQNRYEYNGIEYDSAFGLDEYEAHYRDLDPQIGRWTTIDLKIEDGQESISPYASMNNDPCRISDPLGDVPGLGDIGDALMGGVRWINANLNPLTPIVEVITGKSVESDLTEDKSRVTAAMEGAMFLAPEVKIEGAAAKVVENIAIKDGEKVVAKTAEESAAKVHGNSLQSTKPTTLYKLEKSTGEHLKTGITSKVNPEKRYSKGFMADKKMIRLDKGTRAEMAKKEREIVEKTPGPLNKEPWAGKKKE